MTNNYIILHLLYSIIKLVKNMKRKKLRLKSNVIYFLIFLIPLPILIISTFKIINYTLESPKTKEMINVIIKQTEIIEYESENAEIIESDEHPDTPYWNYIKMDLMDVDFEELKKINKDTTSWIQVGGTNINYPVVQAKDNDYYLTHSFDKSKNKAGWLFMDYRNNSKDYDKNTIIYAHNRKDKTMFGSLDNILTKDWFDNENNRIIKMSSETHNTLWQIFSIYTINTTNDYIRTVFDSKKDYEEFVLMIKDRSIRNFKTKVSDTDRLLTLSTCHGSKKKLVVHAKLIKIEKKENL